MKRKSKTIRKRSVGGGEAGRIVHVVWQDITSLSDFQTSSIDDVSSSYLSRFQTVGEIVFESKELLGLATTLEIGGLNQDDDAIMDLLLIPISVIKKITPLKPIKRAENHSEGKTK